MSVGIREKTLAVMRRDLLTGVRYRSAFLMSSLAMLAELAAFYYLSRAVGPQFRPQGMNYFSFLLVGTGFYTFLMLGINSFLTSIQEAQQNGTLEVLMTTSTPAPVLVVLSAISAFARNSVRLILYLALGFLLLLGTDAIRPNIPGCVAVFVLSIAIAVAIGMVAAALQLLMQKGSAVIWLLGSLAWFMTGTLFPVSALPRPLQGAATLIPITHSLNGMRMALVQGSSLRALTGEIAVLAVFSAVLLPVSVFFFSYTLRQARLRGSLSFY